MSDLERHGIRYRMRGFPIYGSDDEIQGYIDEPEWEWEALTSDQQAQVRRETLRLQTGRSLSWDDAFSFMLGEYGIRCPHKWENHEPSWRECRLCRVAEQLPGRVVTVAGRVLRVSDPPPPTLRIPVPATSTAYIAEDSEPTSSIDVVEYRWSGTHYEIASR